MNRVAAPDGAVAGGEADQHMTVGLIICGALGREVTAIIRDQDWDAEVIGLPAIDHVFPERIAPHVEERIEALRDQYDRLVVVYGDCGSRGALDALLARYPDIDRIQGPHCYEIYAGDQFDALMEEEPGTFFLTDFMVRTFWGLIIKSMGLDRFPQLKSDYFRNYKRIIYLAQDDVPEHRLRAEEIAEYLDLPLEVRVTGYQGLADRIRPLMEADAAE